MYMPTQEILYLLILGALLLSLLGQVLVKRRFTQYSKVPNSRGLTGEQTARMILQSQGVENVRIERVSGMLSDHYDPKNLILRLSQSTADSASVAALSVAAHEVGHVLQHRDAYAPLALRTAAVKTVSFGSYAAWPLFLLGFVLSFPPLIAAGIALYALIVAFSLITLPVEFNASARALALLESDGYLSGDELPGAKKVLSAAAMTYVASALMAVLQLLRLLAIANGRRRD